MSPQMVNLNSELIFNRLAPLDFYKNAQCVMLYLSFRNEVDTSNIISNLFLQNKRVFIPVTVPTSKTLLISELKDFEKDLEIGTFGVLEPKKEALRPISSELIDLVIVPGVAFDERGYRIGYGAGYYDRFLPNLKDTVPTVALAFEVQMIDHVENDEYDFPVQYIITEKRMISCK